MHHLRCLHSVAAMLGKESYFITLPRWHHILHKWLEVMTSFIYKDKKKTRRLMNNNKSDNYKSSIKLIIFSNNVNERKNVEMTGRAGGWSIMTGDARAARTWWNLYEAALGCTVRGGGERHNCAGAQLGTRALGNSVKKIRRGVTTFFIF